jgi:hypothetical protein
MHIPVDTLSNLGDATEDTSAAPECRHLRADHEENADHEESLATVASPFTHFDIGAFSLFVAGTLGACLERFFPCKHPLEWSSLVSRFSLAGNVAQFDEQMISDLLLLLVG